MISQGSHRSGWAKRYHCHACDVMWDALIDENIPDTCWMCEKTDAVSVWTQAGEAVTFRVSAPPSLEAMGSVAHRQWTQETRRWASV